MKRIIWTSSLDLSKEGVARFCREAAGKYGKSEQDLLALPLLDLASRYMWNERRHKLQQVTSALSVSSDAPILVIADKADFGNQSHRECSILSGEHLSEILGCRTGLSTTFYSDGQDIRCEDITEEGTDFYLFRAVTNLRVLGAFTSSVEKGEPFTESQLSEHTRSHVPQIHDIFSWPLEEKSSLDSRIETAQLRQKSNPKTELVSPER